MRWLGDISRVLGLRGLGGLVEGKGNSLRLRALTMVVQRRNRHQAIEFEYISLEIFIKTRLIHFCLAQSTLLFQKCPLFSPQTLIAQRNPNTRTFFIFFPNQNHQPLKETKEQKREEKPKYTQNSYPSSVKPIPIPIPTERETRIRASFQTRNQRI